MSNTLNAILRGLDEAAWRVSGGFNLLKEDQCVDILLEFC
jgi:hypothetical protein